MRYSEDIVRRLNEENAELRADCIRLSAEVRDLTGERGVVLGPALGNLLAVIHRDGGHYQAEHGSKKAAKDAEKIVCGLRDNVERLERERDRFHAWAMANGFCQLCPDCKSDGNCGHSGGW